MARQLEAVYEQGILRPLEPLVLPEHQHVLLTLEEQQPNGDSTANAGSASEEMLWLAQHAASYAGQWVAIQGCRLIAHGARLADVRAAAQAAGVKDPLFASVPEAADVPFGGW